MVFHLLLSSSSFTSFYSSFSSDPSPLPAVPPPLTLLLLLLCLLFLLILFFLLVGQVSLNLTILYSRKNREHHRNLSSGVYPVRLLLVGCLMPQQQAKISQGRICSDNLTCCHTEIEDADQTFYLTPSQYTDTGPTSPSADPITPGAWQGAIFLSHRYDSTRNNPVASGIPTPDLPLQRRTP